MAKLKPFVTDQQWIRLEPWRPTPQPSAKGRPKPRGNRQVFDSIIRLLSTGAGWNHLADRYPSTSTCRPRLQQWEEQGVRVDKKPDNGHYQQSFMIKIIKGRNQSGSGLHISVIAKVSPWALIVLVETPPRAQVSPGRPEMLTYLLMWGESKMDMAKRFGSHRGKYAMITKTY